MTGRQLTRVGALCALTGAVTSGPLGLVLVQSTHPQPPWQDASTFIASYHPVQVLPFALGFALVGGAVLVLAGLHVDAPPALRARTAAAMVFAAAFAAMIVTNYAIQTTVVPGLVQEPSQGRWALLEALTMSNPRSLGWALEMWGYALLGAATWLAAPVFDGDTLSKWTARLFMWNGPVSMVTAAMTALMPGWVLTGAGLWAFGAWNLLFILMMLGAFLATAPVPRTAREHVPLV